MSYFDDLIQQLAPPETFTVTLVPGKDLEFKSIVRYADWMGILKGSQKFVQKVAKKQHPREWEEFLPLPDEALAEVYMLSTLCVTPGITVLDWFKLSRDLGGVFYGIVQAVNRRSATQVFEAEVAQFEEGKGGSGETSGDETFSASAETPTVATRTTSDPSSASD